MLKQIRAAFSVVLGGIGDRMGSSAVTIVGVAGVVGVLIVILAMGQGFQRTLVTTGHPDRAIVVSKGAVYEGSSSLPRNAALRIANTTGVRKDARGVPIASMEMLSQIRLPGHDNALRAVSIRGTGDQALRLRPEIKIVQGRMFRPGLRELIAGRSLLSQFRGLKIGGQIMLQTGPWNIVGIFAAPDGRAHESELFGDADALLSANHRTGFQSVTVQLDGPSSYAGFAAALRDDLSLAVDVYREDKFYAAQSRTITRVYTSIGYFIAIVMAIGATFSALNTMYAAVSSQSSLIATLRAVGFGAGAILGAVFSEALLLALAGALLGIGLAALIFNGRVLAIAPGAQAQLIYAIRITPQLAWQGLFFAVAIGVLGGIFPAIRAARIQVAEALRMT
jgi:putative ABC transport system permease protein